MNKTQQNNNCKLSVDRDEMIYHIICKLVQNDKTRLSWKSDPLGIVQETEI